MMNILLREGDSGKCLLDTPSAHAFEESQLEGQHPTVFANLVLGPQRQS